MVEAVDGGLQLEQQFGIAHVAAQVLRHGEASLEERGEDAAPRGDDRVGGIEDVKSGRAVVGVDRRPSTLLRM